MDAAKEEERVGVRCSRRELQFLDSFVVSGEFRTRSELIRDAIREFLSRRVRDASPATETAAPKTHTAPAAEARAPGSFRQEEMELLTSYADLVMNGASVGDAIAAIVRQGISLEKVRAVVAEQRGLVRDSAERRTRVEGAERTSQELEHRGYLGA
jgi:Arc/MetJ-type ribon-helix-helix transcriptional regulator